MRCGNNERRGSGRRALPWAYRVARLRRPRVGPRCGPSVRRRRADSRKPRATPWGWGRNPTSHKAQRAVTLFSRSNRRAPIVVERLDSPCFQHETPPAPPRTPDLRGTMTGYMVGILRNIQCPSLIIGAVEDHVHILCSLHRTVTIAKLVEEVKTSSSVRIKEEGPALRRFPLAERLWRVFRQPVQRRASESVHSRPGRTPPEADVSGGVSIDVGTPRD